MDPIPIPASKPARPLTAQSYRLPALLHDIRLLDLLELSGTTIETSRLLRLSQPTVSRRSRALARDFALVPNRGGAGGCLYGGSRVMRLLRQACRAHRLHSGVARLGSDVSLLPLLADCDWLLPAPPRFRSPEGWRELVLQGVLDGAVLPGLELSGDPPSEHPELECVPLGSARLDLVVGPRGRSDGQELPPVLLPNRRVALGLHAALQHRGHPLRIAGNGCQTPSQWLGRLQRSGLAMPLLRADPAHWWQGLQRLHRIEPLTLPLWLVLPAGWREQPVLAHTAEVLAGRIGAA
ncbi:MAG: hypothetical protein VKO65_04725 [Cyanobacteriota bacterium]|nr:hypothetical protein [Cyanobacteriota bacterium]